MAKPIKLYSHLSGPNPWKVVIILEELNVPYESEYLAMPAFKQEPFISINPNGRLPAMEDPNTGVTVWESGAIIEYLIDIYDKDHKLSSTTLSEKYAAVSWKHFQMSGQGPYFGQKGWFSHFHPEKNIESAIDRYANEIHRVLGVIDVHLKKSGKPYLVGDKVSYADLMFVPWNNALNGFLFTNFNGEWEEKYPLCFAWHQRLVARDSVKRTLELQAEAKKTHG